MFKKRTLILVGMVFSAALVRVIPHPWNWTPVAALSIFAGATFEEKKWAFAVPLLAIFLSDMALGGLYPFWWTVYIAHLSMVVIGFSLQEKKNAGRVAAACVAGSLSFFLISNLSFFFASGIFPHSFSGLMMCYTAAIPFFRNTVLGDLFFSALLFGSFYLAERRFPVLRGAAVGAH